MASLTSIPVVTEHASGTLVAQAVGQKHGDPLALAVLLDMIDNPCPWTVGLAVREIERRGERAPPCKPTDRVAPVEMRH